MCVIDEFSGKAPTRSSRNGYHPGAYNRALTRAHMDKIIAKACQLCRDAGPETLKQMTLETQMWWRDHQVIDERKKAT
jgi:hypothetical protein